MSIGAGIISDEALLGITDELERLRHLVAALEQQVEYRTEDAEKWRALAVDFARRLTELHSALLPKLDEIVTRLTRVRELEQMIDRIANAVTGLSLVTENKP